jgi:hypothetical protein
MYFFLAVAMTGGTMCIVTVSADLKAAQQRMEAEAGEGDES